MSLDESPRCSARPTAKEHYNSLPRTSIEGSPGTRRWVVERTFVLFSHNRKNSLGTTSVTNPYWAPRRRLRCICCAVRRGGKDEQASCAVCFDDLCTVRYRFSGAGRRDKRHRWRRHAQRHC